MDIKQTVFLLLLASITVGCHGGNIKSGGYGYVNAGDKTDDYIAGYNYTDRDFLGVVNDRLNVTFMKDGYNIVIRTGPNGERSEVIPIGGAYLVTKIYIEEKGEIVKKISGLNDLEGYAEIDTADQAIEFVRLRTSNDTFAYFSPEIIIEIFNKDTIKTKEDIFWGGCSDDFFRNNQLSGLKIEEYKEYFEIKRFVLHHRWRSHMKPVTVFYFTERIYRNGKYEVKKLKIMKEYKLKGDEHERANRNRIGFTTSDIFYPIWPH